MSSVNENFQESDLLREKDREIARLRKILQAHGIPYDDEGSKVNMDDASSG